MLFSQKAVVFMFITIILILIIPDSSANCKELNTHEKDIIVSTLVDMRNNNELVGNWDTIADKIIDHIGDLATVAELYDNLKKIVEINNNINTYVNNTHESQTSSGHILAQKMKIYDQLLDVFCTATNLGIDGFAATSGITVSGLAASAAIVPIYTACAVLDFEFSLVSKQCEIIGNNMKCYDLASTSLFDLVDSKLNISEKIIINDWLYNYCWNQNPNFPIPFNIPNWPDYVTVCYGGQLRTVMCLSEPSIDDASSEYKYYCCLYNISSNPIKPILSLKVYDNSNNEYFYQLNEPQHSIYPRNQGGSPYSAIFNFTIPKIKLDKFTPAGRVCFYLDALLEKEIQLDIPRTSISLPGNTISAIAGEQKGYQFTISEIAGKSDLGKIDCEAVNFHQTESPYTLLSGFFTKGNQPFVAKGHSENVTLLFTVPDISPLGTYTGEIKVETEYGGVYHFDLSIDLLPNDTPPGTITDLFSTTMSEGEVKLEWTAPGGSGASGKSCYYDIRYSTSSITEQNWSSADRYYGGPVPQYYGSHEEVLIDGLVPGNHYYFVIKSIDYFNNISPISNNSDTDAGYYMSFPVEILAPTGVDEAEYNYTIRFDDVDLNKATLYLAYDVDRNPTSMTEIVTYPHKGIVINSHLWDTQNIPNGSYYVYSRKNERGQVSSAYSTYRVNIIHSSDLITRYESDNSMSTAYGPIKSYQETDQDRTATLYSSGDIDWFKFYSVPGVITINLWKPAGVSVVYKAELWYGSSIDNAIRHGQSYWWTGCSCEQIDYQAPHGNWYWVKIYSQQGYSTAGYDVRVFYERDNQAPYVSITRSGVGDGEFVHEDYDVNWYCRDNPVGEGVGVLWVDIQYKDLGEDTWKSWIYHADDTQGPEPFPYYEDDHSYIFRIRAMDKMGNLCDWEYGDPSYWPAIADFTPPTSCVLALDSIQTGIPFKVKWEGYDKTAGVKYYTIEYKKNEDSVWHNLVTSYDDSLFFGTEQDPQMATGDMYYFRSIARDRSGLFEEEVPLEGDAFTFIGVDPWAPDTVSDFITDNLNVHTNVNLNWIASGDDGTVGKASEYEIRYSNVPFTSAEWDTLKKVYFTASPKISGTMENMNVSGLIPGDNYYFAARVKDEDGNLSPISRMDNTIAGLDTVPPRIIEGPFISEHDNTIVNILWVTDEYSNSELTYSIGIAGSETTIVDSFSSIVHKLDISDVVPSEEYHLMCKSSDLYGNTSLGADTIAVLMSSEWLDVTNEILGNGLSNSFGMAWTDYDNDDDYDVYISNNGPNQLCKNESGIYSDAAINILNDTGNGRGAIWGDYDNDGFLDIFIANVGQNKLFHNDGNGDFIEVTEGFIPGDEATFGASWVDYDNDGDLDIYCANAGADSNTILRNDNNVFVKPEISSCIEDDSESFCAAWGDYDNDGDQDVYVVNWGSPNRLFRNDGNGEFMDVTGYPLNDAGNGKCAEWIDYDNDGDLDLYLVNYGSANKLFANIGSGNFVDVTSGMLGDGGTGHGASWGDYDNDGHLDLYLTKNGENILLRNCGGGIFSDTTSSMLADSNDSRGVSWGDYNNDGYLDLYYVNWQSGNKLIQNNMKKTNSWIRIELKGRISNIYGVGARVRVVAGSSAQIREISAGCGYLSQKPLCASFGLGLAAQVDTIEVKWPSGVEDCLHDVPVDTTIEVVEGYNLSIEDNDMPNVSRLYQCYPNPFNPTTTIEFMVGKNGRVLLQIFDVSGKHIRTLINDNLLPRKYENVWDGKDQYGRRVSSGVYFYRIKMRDYSETKKMVLLR